MPAKSRPTKILSNQMAASAAAMPMAVLLMALRLSVAAAPSPPIGLPNCTTTCGGVQVPYPFGLGPPRCYWPGFNLTCDTASPSARLLLPPGTGGSAAAAALRVVHISLGNSTLTAVRTGAAANITSSLDGGIGFPAAPPYSLSRDNELVLIGCNVQATLVAATSNGTEEEIIGGCASSCGNAEADLGWDSGARATGKYCAGIGCCQAGVCDESAPKGLLYRRFDLNSSAPVGEENDVLAFVAAEGWFDQRPVAARIMSGAQPSTAGLEIPLVLSWRVPLGGDTTPVTVATASRPCSDERARRLCKSRRSGCLDQLRGSTCYCESGYEGNPYIIDGCRDINECERPDEHGCFGECTNTEGGFDCRCRHGTHGNHTLPSGCRPITGIIVGIGVSSGAGFVIFVLLAFLVIQIIKRKRITELKRKYFKQNRGQLLQQLVSQSADIAERMIIPLDELAKATNNFDKARELGGGGHGTVYKGILSDLHVVAIKKSKITVQREIDEFINEVAILSQINHKNVVKLFGCCLETEVPLLVYEFISNGTLYHHLHVEGPIALSWANRLRIATEIASGLAYLHTSVSIPVIHRDIKSSNILLDDILTSKVSDFGASKYVPVDKTGLTTRVQGTIGYLDPMYYYSGHLTDKSDVYSFGVILVELLTRKKPFSYLSSDGEGLVSYFVNLLAEENKNLAEILDPQVMEEGGKEIQQVAILAASCIKLRGEDRPTMRQVELTLEGIQASKYGKDNLVAEDFVDDSSGMRSFWPSTKEGESMEELSRSYSMEQDILISARYPR